MAGWTIRFTMFWAWSFHGLLIIGWSAELGRFLKVATLLLLETRVCVCHEVGAALLWFAFISAPIVVRTLSVVSLGAIPFSLAGFILVGVAILGFIGLDILGDGVHEFPHVPDLSFYPTKLVDQWIEPTILF